MEERERRELTSSEERETVEVEPLTKGEVETLLTHLQRSLEMSAFPYGDQDDESVERKLRAAYDPGDEAITRYRERHPT